MLINSNDGDVTDKVSSPPSSITLTSVTNAIANRTYTRTYEIPVGFATNDFTLAATSNTNSVEISHDGTTWVTTALTLGAGDILHVRAELTSESANGSVLIRAGTRDINWQLTKSPYVDFQLQQKIRHDNAALNASFERFGIDVAMADSGTLALSSSSTDHHSALAEPGSGTLFQYANGAWSQIAFLIANDPLAYAKVGSNSALSRSGNRVALYGPARGASAIQAGAIYLFWDSGGGWVQQQKIFSTVGEDKSNLSFGSSVNFTADGNTLVFAATRVDGTVVDEGAAYVYKYNSVSGQFERFQKIAPPDSAYTQFGTVVDVSGDGNVLIVSRITEDLTFTDDGAAYIYLRQTDGTFAFHQKIVPSVRSASQKFGVFMTLDNTGDNIIVGTQSLEGTATVQGEVYTFSKGSDGNWSETARFTAPSPNPAGATQFGTAIHINSAGDRMIVGANVGSDGVSISGVAHVYLKTDGTWALTQTLSSYDGIANDRFGTRVNMSADGTKIIVGSPERDDNGRSSSGGAYIYSEKIEATVTSVSDDLDLLVPAAATDLLAYLPFDTNFTDASDNAHSLNANNNGVTMSVTSISGGGAAAFATTQSLYYNTVPTSTQVSISFWYYPDAAQLAGSRFIDASGYRVRLGTNVTQLAFQSVRNGGAVVAEWLTDRSTIQLNRWHHIVISYDGSGGVEPKIYLNGCPVYIYNSGVLPSNTIVAGNDFAVGGDHTLATDKSLRGLIDEMGVWDTLLTQQDAVNIYRHIP